MLSDVEHHRGGSGEPLLLLHGIGSCWQVWEPLIPALEEHYDVIAIDIPGYGRSKPIVGEPTVYELGDEIERILDSEGLDKVHIAGNSMGGALAAGAATRGRALSVTAFSPGGLSTPREFDFSLRILRNSYAGARAAAPHADVITATAAGRVAAFGIACARAWKIEPASAAHQLRMMAGSPSFKQTLEWIARERPMPPDLPDIDCPFTVAWGTLDLILPPRQAPRWERIVPGARTVMMKGLGHVPMSDDPEQCVRMIRETTARAVKPAAAPASA